MALALKLLGLPCTGNKGQLVEGISNASEIPPHEISIAVDADGADGGESPRVGRKRPVAPLGESLAKDFKRMRPLQADSTHQPARVTNHAGEMACNFINLYDDVLIDDVYLLGAKDVAAECDAIRSSQSNINPARVRLPGFCHPPGLPEVPP